MHELTDKLFGKENYSLAQDSIIRTYLEKKAEEIGLDCVIPISQVMRILGLEEAKSEQPKKPLECKHGGWFSYKDTKVCAKCGYVEPKKAEEWCEHIRFTPAIEIEYTYRNAGRCVWQIPDENTDIKFCPICGTPRPVKQSLREELAKELQFKAFDRTLMNHNVTAEAQYETVNGLDWYKLADIAIKFLESKQ